MPYLVEHSNGERMMCDTYSTAMEHLAERYGLPTIGHDGDINDGGDCTWVWRTESDAKNDDGAKAIAVIRRTEGDS